MKSKAFWEEPFLACTLLLMEEILQVLHHLGCTKIQNLVNSEISTTNLNWLAARFLNHQQKKCHPSASSSLRFPTRTSSTLTIMFKLLAQTQCARLNGNVFYDFRCRKVQLMRSTYEKNDTARNCRQKPKKTYKKKFRIFWWLKHEQNKRLEIEYRDRIVMVTSPNMTHMGESFSIAT